MFDPPKEAGKIRKREPMCFVTDEGRGRSRVDRA